MLEFKRGMTREVILIGPWAIKIPSFRNGKLFLTGMLANMQEREFSHTGWPELCPVKFYVPMGLLVMMPRCKPLSDAEWESLDHRAFCSRSDPYAEINYDLVTGQINGTHADVASYLIPAEHKRCSFGMLNGRVVAVDYGN